MHFKIGFYTIAPTVIGGGGRRVFRGMIKGWSEAGHSVTVISRGKYQNKSKGNIESEFIQLSESLISYDFDFVFCDTEYALIDLLQDQQGTNFANRFPLFAFVHDQIWRDHMRITGGQFGQLELDSNYRFTRNISRFHKKRLLYKVQNSVLSINIFKNLFKLLVPLALINYYQDFSARKRYESLSKLIAKTSGVFSLSIKAAEQSAKMYQIPLEQSRYAFGFIDDELLSLEKKTRHLRKNERSFVCFSRLSPEKNIDYILEAFKRAYTINSDIKLTIIGRNDSEKTASHTLYLKDIVNKIKGSIPVKIIENPSEIELATVLGESGTIICANNCDFNLTILEFLYLGGRAIVPATYDLHKEIDTNFQVSSNNISISDFSSEILRLAEKPITYEKKSTEILKKYSYENYANEVLTHIETIMPNAK
jgi:glycosyltransferase involved in cell wall biosynthesis